MTDGTATRRIVVIGRSDVGRRVCALLAAEGAQTVHLDDPTDAEVKAAITDDVDGVAVLLHDDIRALRYSLIVEHARPGVRLFVAMFDRTARAQLERTVPNSVVLSPASIAVPAMVAAAIAPSHAAVRRRGSSADKEWVSLTVERSAGRVDASLAPYSVPADIRVRGVIGRLRGQLHPYDAGSAVLLGGLFGLLAVILIDTLVGLRHDSFVRALYDATRTTATISAPDLGEETPVLVWATLAALLVMGFTAAFAAGIVHHLISGRHVALVGRRVMPRTGHVIVVGMGQVGLRLAQELRDLGVAVIGVERHAAAPGAGMARELGIPVLVGDATSRSMLRRARVRGAIALVAAGSEERDNIAIAVSASATVPDLPIVIRAGADDAIDETRSLFHIGPVTDVNGLTAVFVTRSMLGSTPYSVVPDGDRILCVDTSGDVGSSLPSGVSRCGCA